MGTYSSEISLRTHTMRCSRLGKLFMYFLAVLLPTYVLKKSLRKHAYSNILDVLPPKNENFQINTFDILHISAQNIDYWYSLKPCF